MKRLALVSMVLAMVICSMSVWSQGQGMPPSGPGGPGGSRRMGGFRMTCPAMSFMPVQMLTSDRMAKTLQISSVQKVKIKKITDKSNVEITTLSKKSSTATKAFSSALMATPYNAKTVKNLALAAEKAEAAVVNAKVNEWSQIRSILSATQIKNLQKMATMRPSSGQGGPGGPPPGGFDRPN
jgi:hypothetical protein